jgi:septal ring factor EnvC (AmiA/AmiB activator)
MSTLVVLSAASTAPTFPSPAEHKENIYQFINEIKEAQDQSSVIAQAILKNYADPNNPIQLQINSISNDLQALNEIIEDYADVIQGLNPEDRQVRLTFNVLNLVRSNLFTLSLLSRAATDIERIDLLDEFFRTRRNALVTLTILETSLERYKG